MLNIDHCNMNFDFFYKIMYRILLKAKKSISFPLIGLVMERVILTLTEQLVALLLTSRS